MNLSSSSHRAGKFIQQTTGYRAFIPEPLPPAPSLVWDEELILLLSEADRALARLDGIGETLPNPDLFVAMYVRKEAVLSSQIEGTQATLEDILSFEVADEKRGDVDQTVNYVRAMKRGIELLDSMPVSLRLIREIHAELLKNVRGQERSPGEFRTSQNWIGPHGCTLTGATFVPPPPHELLRALGDLEKFIHEERALPPLIVNGLVHAQFETIHPFLDGNGRVGRLLISFLLVQRKVIQRPLLYISHFFKRYQQEYYDRLNGVRFRGDWEQWLKFFLRGVIDVSIRASELARRIYHLLESDRTKVQGSAKSLQLLEILSMYPIITAGEVAKQLKIAPSTASRVLAEMLAQNILIEVTGNARNRKFAYAEYLKLLNEEDSL